MANINKIRLSGTTYNIEDANAPKTVELTQAQYDALVSGGTVDSNTFYIITDASGGDLSNYYTKTEVNTLLGGLKLVKLSQSEYNALSPNYDSNTLYVIVN